MQSGKSTGILQDRQFGSFRNKLQGETGSTVRMMQELCQLQRMWPSSVCHSNFFKSTHMRQEETVRTDQIFDDIKGILETHNKVSTDEITSGIRSSNHPTGGSEGAQGRGQAMLTLGGNKYLNFTKMKVQKKLYLR